VDFANGDVLQITGDAHVILEDPQIAAFQGAERLLRVRPRRIVFRPGALPLRWKAGEMTVFGMPLPMVSAILAIIAELGFGLALLIGWQTRPFAFALAFYTLLTAFIGHQYWNKGGAARMEDMEIFFKNIAIMGGVLMLAITGAGRGCSNFLRKSARVRRRHRSLAITRA
jgi:putative oxidoreductase